MKAIIIGASGQIGYAFYRLLHKAGWEVVLLSRRELPYTVDRQLTQKLSFDRYDENEFRKMMSSGADLVIDLVAFSDREAFQLLETQADYSHLIVLSSSSVYKDAHGRTLDEAATCGFPEFDTPILETNATVQAGNETYSTRKIALEEELLSRSTNPLTVLRPCAIYGTHSQHPREWWLVKRMIDQRPIIPLAYYGESMFHSTSARSIAEVGFAAAALKGQQVINVGDKDPLSVLEIAKVIATYLGYEGRLLPIAKEEGDFKYVGMTPWSTPRPFLLNTEQATGILAASGQTLTSYESSVQCYLGHLEKTGAERPWQELYPQLAAYPYPQFDYKAEDRYLASLTKYYS